MTFTRFLSCGLLAAVLAPLSAAQVQGTVLYGNLLVWGGSAAESVSITGTGGTLTVIGNGGTTVNGLPAVTFENVTGALLVGLGGGDDQLFFSEAEVHCGALLAMGSGDDLVFAARNQIFGHLLVDGGGAGPAGDLIALSDGDGIGNVVTGTLAVCAARATVVVRGSQVGHDIRVQTGCAADQVKIDGCVVGDDVFVDTNGGDDLIDVGSLGPAVGNTIAGSLVVDAGSGNDVVRVGTLDGGASTVGSCSALYLGYGNDQLVVRGTTFQSFLVARGNSGTDAAELQSVAFGNSVVGGLYVDGFEALQ
ncbi:MAG: hypothetical protein IPJ77_05600 [Planctomycetes bacterium]|nr:hypothetical protein [Planctomycetota bacterium]